MEEKEYTGVKRFGMLALVYVGSEIVYYLDRCSRVIEKIGKFVIGFGERIHKLANQLFFYYLPIGEQLGVIKTTHFQNEEGSK